MSTVSRETRPTSDLTKSARAKHKEYLFPATIQYYQEPIVVTDAKGLRVRDADGNPVRYGRMTLGDRVEQ